MSLGTSTFYPERFQCTERSEERAAGTGTVSVPVAVRKGAAPCHTPVRCLLPQIAALLRTRSSLSPEQQRTLGSVQLPSLGFLGPGSWKFVCVLH